MSRHTPYIRSQPLEVAVGVALFIAAATLIYDAFEGRGKKRPIIARVTLP